MRRRTLGATGLALLALLVAPPLPAEAAYPGKNGRLALVDRCNVFTVNPDGSDEQQLTFFGECNGEVRSLAWSPDGTKIAFGKAGIYVINADGSGLTNITPGRWAAAPAWSPDGTRIAYHSPVEDGGTYTNHIFISNADGSNPVRLLPAMCASEHPRWHPDGTRIAFLGYATGSSGSGCTGFGRWMVNVDGTGMVPLPTPFFHDYSPDGAKVVHDSSCTGTGTCYPGIWTQPADGSSPPTKLADGSRPHWSPDGQKMLFRRVADGPCFCPHHLYTINLDGTGLAQVSTHHAVESSWQPIPINFYARPKSATLLEASLVPAYTQCTAPDRTHGPPLASDSCNPPAQASDELTLGSPDANGKPAGATGPGQVRGRARQPRHPSGGRGRRADHGRAQRRLRAAGAERLHR